MSSHAVRPAQRTDEDILAAARQLLVERGFGGMSMRCLSHRVGLHAGSLYHHFSGKQEVLEEVLGAIVEHRLYAWRAVHQADRLPWPRLQRFIAFHVQHVHAHLNDQAVLHSERRYMGREARLRLEQLESEYYLELHHRVADGASAGVFSIGSVDMAASTLRRLLECIDGLGSADMHSHAATHWMIELASRVLQVKPGAR